MTMCTTSSACHKQHAESTLPKEHAQGTTRSVVERQRVQTRRRPSGSRLSCKAQLAVRVDSKAHLKDSASKNSLSSGGHCHSFQVDFSCSRLVPSSKISSRPGSRLTVMVVPSLSSAASAASRAAAASCNQTPTCGLSSSTRCLW